MSISIRILSYMKGWQIMIIFENENAENIFNGIKIKNPYDYDH